MRLAISTALALLSLSLAAMANDNLIRNGDFEQGTVGWSPFWSRSGDGQVEVITRGAHDGQQAVHIAYPGQQDWSFPQAAPLDVQPGDIFELTGWIRITGSGRVALSVILYDADRQAISWSFGGTTVSKVETWRQVRSRFVIPRAGVHIAPRLMGNGPAEVWLDDVALVKTGTLDQLKANDLPETVTAASQYLRVSVNCQDATIAATDLRTGRTYRQHPGSTIAVLSARSSGRTISLRLLKPDDVLTVDATIQLEENVPEWTVELSATGDMREPLQFPAPFATESGELLIMPVNEGISYPVDDASLPPMEYHLYGGHGLCMSFWGATNLKQGLLAIVETPDDARVGVPRIDGRLCLAPAWLPQKTVFGPARRIRYVSLDDGGYVAMCKRYRAYAQHEGRLKTLAEKRQENPHVDLLIGAVNVWCWDLPATETCTEMQSLGIERILWSRRSEPEQIQRLNEMGVLSSRYDIYQDVMDPANFPKLGYRHPDWTSEAWPKDVIIDAGRVLCQWLGREREGRGVVPLRSALRFIGR